MTTPITPTGKRLWAEEREYNMAGQAYLEALVAIEQEARAMERERLVAEVQAHHTRIHHGQWELCASPVCYGIQLLASSNWLLADPEPDR